MVYQNAIRLQVYPMAAYVKIGDTLPDIEEGLNAGVWTIGLTMTGNLLGLTEREVKALDESTLNQKRKKITERFYQVGAHFVADGLWDCPRIIQEIDTRLARGERP
jgi:phosphonoacetaldehyde hydrolase